MYIIIITTNHWQAMLWKIVNKEANNDLYLYLRALFFISCFSKFSSRMSFSGCFIYLPYVYGKILHSCCKKKKKIWSQKKWFQKYPTSASKKRSSSHLGNEYIKNHLNYSILLNSTFIWRVWLLSLATFRNYNPVYRITFAENLLFYFEHFLPWSWMQIKHVCHPYSADFLMNKQQ